MENLKEKFFLYYLGRTTKKEVLSLISEENLKSFLEWSELHKMLSVSFPLIQEQFDELRFLNKESKEAYIKAESTYRQYKNRRLLILESLNTITKSLKGSGDKYAYIKGLSFEKYYPEEIERFTNDIDIVIDSPHELSRVLTEGFIKGYEHISMPTLRKDINTNQYLGVFKLKETSLDESFCWEFILGGFAFTDITHLPSSAILNKTEVLNINGMDLSIPTIEVHLLILLGELVTRPTLYLRDIIDFIILINKMDSNKLSYLKAMINKYKLNGELKRVVDQMCAFPTGFTVINSEELRFFLNDVIRTPLSFNDRIFDLHIMPYLKEFRENKYAQRDYKYFFERHRLSDLINYEDEECPYISELLKLNDTFGSISEQLNEGHHVFLIQLDYKNYDIWEIEKRNSFHFLKTPSGLYWLSQEGIETDESYKEIELITRNGF